MTESLKRFTARELLKIGSTQTISIKLSIEWNFKEDKQRKNRL
jgi:hypothetical protein